MGSFGDLATQAWARITQIESTLALRHQQLASAIENNSDKEDVYRRAVESLEKAIGGIRLEAQQLEESGIWYVLGGLISLLLVKIIQAIMANKLLEKRYSDWLSDPKITRGMRWHDIGLASGFTLLIAAACVVHYSFPNTYTLLAAFPTEAFIRLEMIEWVEAFFAFCVANGEVVFDLITIAIRTVLDGLELVFVKTPWMVIAKCHHPAHRVVRWGSRRDFLRCISLLHGVFGVLGKGDDNLVAAGHSRLLVYRHRHSPGYVLCPPPPVLRCYPSYNGLYADHAGVCIHDPGHCVLRYG